MSSALINHRRRGAIIRLKIPLAYFLSLLLQIYLESATISAIRGFDEGTFTKNTKIQSDWSLDGPRAIEINFRAGRESANQFLLPKFDGNNGFSLIRSKRNPANSNFYDDDDSNGWKTVYHWKKTKTKTTTRKKGKGRRKNGTAKKPAQRQWEEEKQIPPKVNLNRRRKPFSKKQRKKHYRTQKEYFFKSPEADSNDFGYYYQSMPMANQGEIPMNSDSECQMVQDGHHPELERVQNKSLVREIPGDDDDEDNEKVIDEGNSPIQERFEVTPDVPPPLQNPSFDKHDYGPGSSNNMENPQNGKIWPNNDNYDPRVDNYHHSTENASRRFEPSTFRNTKNNWKKNKSSPQPSTKKRGKKKLFDRVPDSSPADDPLFSFKKGGSGKPPPEPEYSLHREGKSSPAPRKHIQKPPMYPESNRFQDVSDRAEKDSPKFPSISHYYTPPVKHKSSRKNSKNNSIHQKADKTPDKIMSPDEGKRLEGIEANGDPSKVWRSSDFERNLSVSSTPKKSAESDNKMDNLFPRDTDSIDGKRPHQISFPSNIISFSLNDKQDSVPIPENIARVDPENSPNPIKHSTKDKQPFLSENSSSFVSQNNGTVSKNGTGEKNPRQGQNSAQNKSVISVPIRPETMIKDVSDEGSNRPASSNSTTRWFREQDSLRGNPYASIPLSSDELKQPSATSLSLDDSKNASSTVQTKKSPLLFGASSSSMQQTIPSETLPRPNSTDKKPESGISQNQSSGGGDESIVSRISILPSSPLFPALHRSVPHYSNKKNQNHPASITDAEQISILRTKVPLIHQKHHFFDSWTRGSTSSSFSYSSPPTNNPDISLIKIDSSKKYVNKTNKNHNASQKTARKALHFPPWSGSHETMRRLFTPKKTPATPWSASAETLRRLFEDEQSKQHQKGSGVQSASRRKQPSPPWSGSGETFRQLFEHKTIAASPPKPIETQNSGKKRKRGESDTLPRNTPRSSSHRPTMGNENIIKSVIGAEGTTPPKKRRKTDFNHASSPASASFSNGSITRGQKERALSPKTQQSSSQNPAMQFGEAPQTVKDSDETLQNLLAKAAANRAVEMASSSGRSQNEGRNGRFKEIHEMLHNPMFFGFPVDSDSEITNDSDANLKSNISNKRESHSTGNFNQSSNNFKANFVKFGRHNDSTKTENRNDAEKGSATQKVSPFGQKQQEETTKAAQKKNLTPNKGLKQRTRANNKFRNNATAKLKKFARLRKTVRNHPQDVAFRNKDENVITQAFGASSEAHSFPPFFSAPILEVNRKAKVETNCDDSKMIETKVQVGSVAATETVHQNPHYQYIQSGDLIRSKTFNEHRPNHPHHLKAHQKYLTKPNNVKDKDDEEISNGKGSNRTEIHRLRTKSSLSILQLKAPSSKMKKTVKEASQSTTEAAQNNAAAAVVSNDEVFDVVSASKALQNAIAKTSTNAAESVEQLQTFSPPIEVNNKQKSSRPKQHQKSKIVKHHQRLVQKKHQQTRPSDGKAGQVEKTPAQNDSYDHKENSKALLLKPTSEPLLSEFGSVERKAETNFEPSEIMNNAEGVISIKKASTRRPALTSNAFGRLFPAPKASSGITTPVVDNVDDTTFSYKNEHPDSTAIFFNDRHFPRQRQSKKVGPQQIRRNRLNEKRKTTMDKGETRRPSKNFGVFVRPNTHILDSGSNGTERLQRGPVVVPVEKISDFAPFAKNSSGFHVVEENDAYDLSEDKNFKKKYLNARKHAEQQHHYSKSIFVGQKNPRQKGGSEVENIDLTTGSSPFSKWTEGNLLLLEGYSEEQWYRAAHYPGGPPLLVTVRKRNRPKVEG